MARVYRINLFESNKQLTSSFNEQYISTSGRCRPVARLNCPTIKLISYFHFFFLLVLSMFPSTSPKIMGLFCGLCLVINNMQKRSLVTYFLSMWSNWHYHTRPFKWYDYLTYPPGAPEVPPVFRVVLVARS